jgi:hypothetical protein
MNDFARMVLKGAILDRRKCSIDSDLASDFRLRSRVNENLLADLFQRVGGVHPDAKPVLVKKLKLPRSLDPPVFRALW